MWVEVIYDCVAGLLSSSLRLLGAGEPSLEWSLLLLVTVVVEGLSVEFERSVWAVRKEACEVIAVIEWILFSVHPFSDQQLYEYAHKEWNLWLLKKREWGCFFSMPVWPPHTCSPNDLIGNVIQYSFSSHVLDHATDWCSPLSVSPTSFIQCICFSNWHVARAHKNGRLE